MKNIFKTAGSIASILALSLIISCGNDDGGGDNPSTTIINFSDSESTVAESDGSITLTVDFDRELAEDAHFMVQVSGTATFGEDYTVDAETGVDLFHIYVTAGQTSAAFTLNLVDDDEPEVNETIILELVSDLEILWPGENAFLTITLTSEDYEEIFVTIDQQNKLIYQLDPEKGVLSNPLEITFEGSNDYWIKSLSYDIHSEKLYLLAFDITNRLNQLYLIDPKTGTSQIAIEELPVPSNYSSSFLIDFIVAEDYFILSGALGDIQNQYKPSLLWVDKQTYALSDYWEGETGLFSLNEVSGLSYGSDNELVLANVAELFILDTNNSLGDPIEIITNDQASFTLAYSDFTNRSAHFQDLARSSDGTIHGIISLYLFPEQPNTNILITIDPSTGEMSYLSHFESGEDLFQNIEIVPASVFE